MQCPAVSTDFCLLLPAQILHNSLQFCCHTALIAESKHSCPAAFSNATNICLQMSWHVALKSSVLVNTKYLCLLPLGNAWKKKEKELNTRSVKDSESLVRSFENSANQNVINAYAVFAGMKHAQEIPLAFCKAGGSAVLRETRDTEAKRWMWHCGYNSANLARGQERGHSCKAEWAWALNNSFPFKVPKKLSSFSPSPAHSWMGTWVFCSHWWNLQIPSRSPDSSIRRA